MEPYEGREPYIFISYARKDKARVMPYLDALSGAGYRVWYDKGIKAGEHWTETLVEKVEACAVFCPLFSEAFNASRFCFEETEYAYRKDKPIVPVYLEELKPDDLRPLYRLLGSRQDLRLYQFDSAAQFAERLKQEQAFALCKALPEWNKIGQIQWHLSANGTLSIAKRKDLPEGYTIHAPIPAYQQDPVQKSSNAPWMPYREKVLSVEIADDIDTIGDYAFAFCESITDVRIPNSVTKIGDFAFEGCKSLTEIRIPDSVIIIGDFAFYSCESLRDVRIPDSVTEIGDFAFYSCVGLKDVRIPDSVTEIGVYAFEGCENLTNVRIPDNVTIIGDGTFFFCKNLTNVRIPNSVAEIGDFAFSFCKSLKSVEIPTGAKVGFCAFPEHTFVTRRKVVDIYMGKSFWDELLKLLSDDEV